MIETDERHVEIARGVPHDPWHDEGAADLDDVRALMPNNLGDAACGEHEAVRLLARNRWSLQPIHPNAVVFSDGIAFARHRQHVSQPRSHCDVLGLLQQICTNAAARIPEPLGDIHHAKCCLRSQHRRQHITANVDALRCRVEPHESVDK